MSLLLKVAVGLVCAYVLVVLVAHWGQRQLMYFPSPERVRPLQAGITGVEERMLTAPDGVRIIAWYAKAKPGQPTLLYFHGNAGNLAGRVHRMRALMQEGWGVYMLSYRGYSGSGGSPSEKDNVADARLAYGALVLEGVNPQGLVLYGESLGSGIAARLATERPAAGLILEAPYTSILEVAQNAYPFLPVGYLLTDRYESDKVIRQVHMPLLVLHGQLDGVIDVALGRKLFALANEPKQLVVFPEGGHSNLYAPANDAIGKIREWLRGLNLQLPGRPS